MALPGRRAKATTRCGGVTPRGAFDRLLRHYGPQGWWPATTRFEVVVGALLMAQTSWRRVEESLRNLRGAGLLRPEALASAALPRLRRLVRPAGLHQSKARRLREASRRIVEAGGLARLLTHETRTFRRTLLQWDGVGEETADSILLYAAQRPVFVVDAYTRRLGERLGWFRAGTYAGVQEWFEDRLPVDADLFNEFHALIVAHVKRQCRPRPRCPDCPLLGGCPHGHTQLYPRRDASKTR